MWTGSSPITLTEAAWRAFRDDLARAPRAKFAIVPMARVVDNADLLRPDFAPPADDFDAQKRRAERTLRFCDDQAAQDVAGLALEQVGQRHQAGDLGPQTARKPAAAKRTM